MYAVDTNFDQLKVIIDSLSLFNCNINDVNIPSTLYYTSIVSSNITKITSLISSHQFVYFKIRQSSIGIINNVIIMRSLFINDCDLGVVNSNGIFFHSLMVVFTSSIQTIKTNGIQNLIGGKIFFNGVSIETLEVDSVILAAGTKLYLNAVNVVNCQSPCFVLDSVSALAELINVTINGNEVDMDTFHQYARYNFKNHTQPTNSLGIGGYNLNESNEDLILRSSNLTSLQNIVISNNISVENCTILEKVRIVLGTRILLSTHRGN